MSSAVLDQNESSRLVHAGGQILYLIFDGVVHNENVLVHPKKGAYLQLGPAHHLFAHASLLAHLLLPYPEVKIGVSTSWVLKYGCADTAERLLPRLRNRVIEATYYSSMDKEGFRQMPRWQQIVQDYGRRRPTAWLSLDDDDEGLPDMHLDNYLRTDPFEGISEPAVLEKLQRKLHRIFWTEIANGHTRHQCKFRLDLNIQIQLEWIRRFPDANNQHLQMSRDTIAGSPEHTYATATRSLGEAHKILLRRSHEDP